MKKKYVNILFKLLLLIIASAAGWLLYALSANLLIYADAFSETALSNNIGVDMTQKAIKIWVVSVILGSGSVFVRSNFKYFLLIVPLVTPSLFALFYTLNI